MRLFYFSGSLIPSDRANSVHVMKMCHAFAHNGVQVTLFGKTGGAKNPFSFYGVSDIFSLCLSPFKNGFLRLLFSAYQFFKGRKPDVAYGRDPWMLCLAALVCPVVLELHEVPRGLQKKAVNFLIKNNNTKLIVCISNGLKSDILFEFSFDKKDFVFVAHDGADLNKSETIGILSKSRPCIGYVGSLLPGKGAEIVIRLAAYMHDFDFHICGGSAEQINKLRIQYSGHNVHYHGHVAHADLPAYMQSFDIVLAPYQEQMALRTGANIARWISPLKLFEYMAAEKAIICSDLPVLREILRDGDTALLVSPADIEAWQAAIERLMADDALRTRLAVAGRETLGAHYTWDKRAKNLLTAIKAKIPSVQ